MTELMAKFLLWVNGVPGIALGYLGIGLTYLCTGILACSRVGVSKAFIFAGILFILIFALIINGVEVLGDVDSARILAYLGIGAGLSCAAWSARRKGKRMWAMMGPGLFFSTVGLILRFS